MQKVRAVRKLLSLLFVSLFFFQAAFALTTHENGDLTEGDRLGWSIETPDDWRDIPGVQPPWPIGGGYQSKDGKCRITVVWLKDTADAFRIHLTESGYQEADCRLGGFSGKVYSIKKDGVEIKHHFITRSGGTYRITTEDQENNAEILEKALNSFTFIRKVKETSDTGSVYKHESGFTFPCPPGCKVRDKATGCAVIKNGAVIIDLTLYPGTGIPGQSFRGLARNLGKNIPGAETLAKFEPYNIGNTTAYQALWQTISGSYIGPLLYIPVDLCDKKALELKLINPNEATVFYKIANSIKMPAK